MPETHPFGNFVPGNPKYLLLGSFVAKPAASYDFFFSNGRNHFWPIMEKVYGRELKIISQKQKLFRDLEIAMADIIFSCERRNNTNLDTELFNIVYNDSINEIAQNNKIQKIFFTSRFVETHFKKHFINLTRQFGEDNLIYLPSPSPRYAAMSRRKKIGKYKELLPSL